jgi:hypothetical protein
MIDIAVATCANVPDLDAHDALLLTALTERGVKAQPLVWDAPTVDWNAPAITLVRSTWGYYHQHSTFLAWAQRVSQLSTLWNPLDVLEWNTHKSYLFDLERKGVPIVPTIWLTQGTTTHLSSLMAEHNWQKVVIKPAISAGSYATILVTNETIPQGQSHLDQFLLTRDMLIQPFLPTITSVYERSLIFIDGAFTHAVQRVPALGLDPNGEVVPITPHDAEMEVALKALEAVSSSVLYARVDLIRDEESVVRLMELELVEPDLWLAFAPHATDRFANALVRKLAELK